MLRGGGSGGNIGLCTPLDRAAGYSGSKNDHVLVRAFAGYKL